jgi:hypothetical protein
MLVRTFVGALNGVGGDLHNNNKQVAIPYLDDINDNGNQGAAVFCSFERTASHCARLEPAAGVALLRACWPSRGCWRR